MLFNSSEVRFSRNMQDLLLDWARELGATSVPTLGSLERCQKRLDLVMRETPCRFCTHTGNVYYVNSITSLIKQVRMSQFTEYFMLFY